MNLNRPRSLKGAYSTTVLTYYDSLGNCADAYAAPAHQKNPYVSPVYGDYTLGYPPTLIQVGTKEIFLSNAIRHYHAIDNAGPCAPELHHNAPIPPP